MPNPDNLSRLTKEQRVEYARKAGLASAKKRQERKKMAETLNIIMKMPLKKGDAKNLEKIKAFSDLNGLNLSVQDALMILLTNKALKGDLKAILAVRDTLGDAPKQQVQLEEIDNEEQEQGASLIDALNDIKVDGVDD